MTPVTPSSVPESRWDALTREALRMIGDQDLSHWSDGHDTVTIDALRAALAERTQQEAPMQPSRIRRLKDAIEGECDGLAITDDHAKAILEYVDATPAPPMEPKPATRRYRDYSSAANSAKDGTVHVEGCLALQGWPGCTCPAAPTQAPMQPSVLQALLDHVDGETCRHETTHRGGAIWTICDDCDRKWADDEGGFVPYEDPPAVAAARAALAAPTQAAGGEAVAFIKGWDQARMYLGQRGSVESDAAMRERMPKDYAAAPAAAVEPPYEVGQATLREAVQFFFDALDRHHDTKNPPAKYTVPWGAVNALRATLTAFPAAAAPEGLTPATEYARNLAVALHRDCYPEVTQWKPLDELLGLLTQIDNMVSGMARIKPATPDAKTAEGRKP